MYLEFINGREEHKMESDSEYHSKVNNLNLDYNKVGHNDFFLLVEI
jgi:hypothetical protein